MTIKTRLKKLEIAFQCDELAKTVEAAVEAAREKRIFEECQKRLDEIKKQETVSKDQRPTSLNLLLGITED